MDFRLRHFLLWIYLACTIFTRHCDGQENLALGKPAIQLGTFDHLDAKKAVDGGTNQNLDQNSCAHPHSADAVNVADRQLPTWLSVDLADGSPDKTFVIKSVKIYFRSDCCGGKRVRNNQIWIGDEQGTKVGQTLCAETLSSSTTVQNLTCTPPLKAVRYVTIMHKTERSLGICELIVHGYKYKPCLLLKWGENCQSECNCDYSCDAITSACEDKCPYNTFGKGCNSNCNCKDGNEVCGLTDGRCASGCADGYTGTNCRRKIPALSGTPTVTTTTTTSITLQFNRPSNPADYYEVEYKIRYGNTKFTSGKSIEDANSPTLSITQDNLSDNTEYELRIIPYISPAIAGRASTSVVGNTKRVFVPAPATTTTTPTTTTTATSGSESNDSVSSSASTNNSATVPAVVVVILVLIATVFVFIVVYRFRSGKSVPFRTKLERLVNRTKDNDADTNSIIEPPVIIPITDGPNGSKRSSAGSTGGGDQEMAEYENSVLKPAIPVEELGKYIEMKKKTADGFKDEFKKLPVGTTCTSEVGDKLENKNKNRFLNIRAYDHSRVVLDLTPGDPHSDYINADYLPGYGGVQKAYIAAQGPKKGPSVEDTWRMVWQTNTNRVVMVTNLVEGGRVKCEQYWPESGSATYGELKVTLITTNSYAPYVIRIFNVELGDKSRTVRQFHFTSWPDHGVPTVATELLEFRKRVKSFDAEATGPLIIHCSAGVGRTGTYIAVDYCLQQAKLEDEVNIWEITNQMRRDRVNMIQTLDQYIFVYDAIYEALKSGETNILASQFSEQFRKLCKEPRGIKQTPLGKQFETLETLKTPLSDGKPLIALEEDNIKKNRFKEIVPSNRFRPFLSTLIDGTNTYINAVYVDGFRSKLAYLIAQMPLPNTVIDFWRLIHDHHSTTVIMLNAMDEDDSTIGTYWPDNVDSTMTFGPIEVTLTSVDTDNANIIIRDFKLANSKTRRNPVVRQFQVTSWPKDEILAKDRATLLQVIELVEKWQQQTGNGPITIHCLDGATRCGLMVASMYVNEQLKVDQEVDVYRAVKQVRIPRPQFIADIEQYKFIHEMVIEYMSSFGDYSNFS